MEKVDEIKIPEGVESISVTQHEDKIVIEFVHEELKRGDWAIFWDNKDLMPLIRLYHGKTRSGNSHIDSFGALWDNAVKWNGTKEQFEKVLRGEI